MPATLRWFHANRPLRYRSWASRSRVGRVASRVEARPPRWTLSAPTIERAMSSCTANTSARSRSYSSAQSWYPSRALTSCAEIRTRLPLRRTLPSSTDPTSSARPTWRTSTSRPLYWKAEVRAATRSPSTLLSSLISSSVSPSLKYSWSCPGLRSREGEHGRGRGRSSAGRLVRPRA